MNIAEVQKLQKRADRTQYEDLLVSQIKALELPQPVREYRFCPPRRWRFDLAFVQQKLGIEVDGGAFSGGRHTRGQGFSNDLEKFNAATIHGWRVLRFTPDMVTSGAAVAVIKTMVERYS